MQLEGTVIGGDFRVLRPLASGGHGGVYVAEQLSTGQQRALKLMHSTLVADPRMTERFVQEARVGSRVHSQHVVQVIGAGVDPAHGVPWLAMELLDGEDLGSFAARRGTLPMLELVPIFRQLCHALGAAHAAGIVHRDVKPENVFLANVQSSDARSQVKVLDFGIAKLVAEAQQDATSQIGTPLWMAPEQSDSSAAITPAADVWALGLLAFRLLTGKYYWRVANQQGSALTALFRETLTEPLVPASARAREYGMEAALPPGFDDWFARAVVREPAHRFQNAQEAFAALEGLGASTAPAPFVAASTLQATHPTPAPSTAPPRRSKLPVVLGVGFLGLLLLGALGLGAGVFFFRDELGLGSASLGPGTQPSVAGSNVPPVQTSEPSVAPTPSDEEQRAVAKTTQRTKGTPTATTGKAEPLAPEPEPKPSAEPPKPAAEGTTLDVGAVQKKVNAQAAAAGTACAKDKTPGMAMEAYSGMCNFHPDGTGGGFMQGAGGAKACVQQMMLSLRLGKFTEPKGTQSFPWSVTVK